jgi:hypothetical protein
MGRAKARPKFWEENAHKGDATPECQGRYPDVAMQNMMLRVRNVKFHSYRFMKRFFIYITIAYCTPNRDVFDFASHSDDRATTDRSGSVNQISTNV